MMFAKLRAGKLIIGLTFEHSYELNFDGQSHVESLSSHGYLFQNYETIEVALKTNFS